MNQLKLEGFDTKECYVKDRFVFPCRILSERLVEPGRIGISIWSITNIRKGTDVFSFASHKISKKDNGMVLNYCPWCGGKIYEKQDEKGKTE